MAFNDLDIEQTHFDDIASCANVAIYSPRRAGKSTFMAYMCHIVTSKCGVRKIIVFCGNRDTRGHFAKVVHPLFIHGPDLVRLKELITYQENVVGEAREQFDERMVTRMQEDPTFVPPEFEVPDHLKIAIFADDLASNTKFATSPEMKALASDGRHFGAYLFTSYQKATKCLPEIRDNADYVAVLQCTSDIELTRLHTEYVGDTIVDKKTFRYIVHACTTKAGWCLWIRNDGKGTDLRTRLCYARIPWPVPHQRVGSRQYQAYGQRHYLSRRRQEQLMARAVPAPAPPPATRVSFDLHSVDGGGTDLYDDEEPDEADDASVGGSVPLPAGSIVSLNRRPHVALSSLRSGRHTFQDQRGNVINVNMLK